MAKLVKKDDDLDFCFQETIDTPETEIVEEMIYVNENLIKNKDLIRLDMNIVQFPIFSKNPKRKVNQIVKYFFNKNRDTYITVTPAAGDYIPGDAEEKVFIALMQLMKEKGMPKKFIISSNELKDKLKLNTNRYAELVKKSLIRLSKTNYNFKNTMYSSEYKGIIKEEISTPILSLRIITLSLNENRKYRSYYKDKRIKEIYEINISNQFYNNIIQKGYLVYNSNILLEIPTSTTRTIYMLIEKLRFNNLYLKIDTMFLIKRIPLKYSKNSISRTVKLLESSFDELRNKTLISDFKIIKESTWEKSEIEIFFNEDSQSEKQLRFFEDFNDYKKLSTALTVLDTEHDILVIPETKEEISFEVTKEKIEIVFNTLPLIAKKLKSMPKTIADSIEQYGFEKVMKVAVYISKQKNLKSPRAYFIKALEGNWAQEVELKPLKKEEQEKPAEIEEIKMSYEKEMDYFESLSEEKRKKIEEMVYNAYIEECGVETKIQKLAFKGARRKLISEYIINKQLIKKDDIINLVEEKTKKEEIVTDINVFKDYISNSINVYQAILELTDEKIFEIKKEILSKLTSKFVLKTLTIEEIDETISKKLR